MDHKVVLSLACIVEGKGDVEAVRVLLERLSEQSQDAYWVQLAGRPNKRGRGKLATKHDEKPLADAIELAVRQLQRQPPPKGILILLDADDDCPAELGPRLLERAKRARSDMPISVVVAKRKYEAWLLAGFEGICGKRGFPAEMPDISDPEAVGDAKKRLTELLRRTQPHGSYKETVDQAALTHHFDLCQARKRSPSFDKLCREIEHLVRGG